MGMFDDLVVDCALPDPRFQDCRFQTKDLGCNLSSFRLTREGLLVKDADLTETEKYAVPEPQTDTVATVFFYDYKPVPGVEWVEFKAVIVDGRLHRPIELVRVDRKGSSEE